MPLKPMLLAQSLIPYFMGYLPISDIIILILQVIVGIIIYVGYSMAFKLEEYRICKYYMSFFAKKLKPSKNH